MPMTPLRSAHRTIDALDEDLMRQAQTRLDQLTKPLGSLGRLEMLAKQIVGVTRRLRPVVSEKVIITMAGDHGVVARAAGERTHSAVFSQRASYGRDVGLRAVQVDAVRALDSSPVESSA